MTIKEKIIKKPFKYLIILFLFVYLSSTILVSYFIFNSHLKSISKLVLSTINQESDIFKDFLDRFEITGEIGKQIEKSLLTLSSRNFVFIKVYDKNFNILFVSNSLNSEEDKKIFKFTQGERKKYFNVNKKEETEFFFYKKRLYFLLLKKLGNKGFIESIYKVPDDINTKIKKNLIQSIEIVSFVLLIAFLVTGFIVTFLTKTIKRFNLNLLNENINSLKTIGSMIAKRDSETGDHNYRVTYYTVKIAENMEQQVNMQALIKGAFLHDIGKIAIKDSILLKPGELTSEEFEIMKLHVLHGYEIIKSNKFLEDAVDIVLYHHEKVDGSGYMKGLVGDDIPLNARIFAVADVFDALTSKRPYKKPFSFEESINIIKRDQKKHFCPFVVEAFEKVAYDIYMDVKDADSIQLQKLIQEVILKYFK